ncbi:MAG: acetate--CoA ligase family protein [Pseudomonadota bacterium]
MSVTDGSLGEAVFDPRSVGLIGLSSRVETPAGRVLGYLRQHGYGGRVVVVNPAREEVQGEPALKSIVDAGPVPDHAYILVGTNRVEQAVRDCAEAGVKVASILADGFAESGPEGAAAQARLVDIAREGGLRLIGPNSMGIGDLHSGALITTNAIYQEPDPLRGRVSLISQSGSMMGGLISRAKAIGVGFSRIASVGNECDLGIPELGEMMLEDPNTDVLTLFLETLRDADGLARMAARAHDVGKPIIAFKLGRSSVGQEMAVAHTGALLAEDPVADAFLREIGIGRVTTLDGLIEAPMLFAGRRPGPRPARVGVLTTTGGGGATVCDRLALEGVTIQPPSEVTKDAIRATGLEASFGPMVDLTMAGAAPKYVRPTIEAIAADPEVDLVLSVTGSSGRSAIENTVAPLQQAELGGKPLAAFIVPDALPTLQRMTMLGISAYRSPESAADAIGAFCRWRAPRIRALARKPSARDAKTLDEEASLSLLADVGMPVVARVTVSAGEAPELPFPYPVVAKVLSDAVPHKTEAGGVVVGIDGPDALKTAGRTIKSAVEGHHPGVVVEQLLVAPMIRPLQEVLIGYRLDPQVGPLVTLAPGGILVGLYDDKAIRLAPVDVPTAREMIAEVVGLAPLRGHRGLPEGDLDALAQAVAAISTLATHTQTILEAEANPVMVLTDGVLAADGLVTLANGEPQ